MTHSSSGASSGPSPAFAPMTLPGEGATFNAVAPPSFASEQAYGAVQALLGDLADTLGDWLADWLAGNLTDPPTLDLATCPADVRTLMDETLGHGEVSARIEGKPLILIQETAFTGVWRIVGLEADGRRPIDRLEAAPLPAVVRDRFLEGAILDLPDRAPDDLTGVTGILAELRGARDGYRPGDPAHVVTLTLLPVSQAGLPWLVDALGVGPCVMLSRGYGNCRITGTQVANVWWVQYFNSEDSLILNTLEVVDLPGAALATEEDLAESVLRLRTCVEDLGQL